MALMSGAVPVLFTATWAFEKKEHEIKTTKNNFFIIQFFIKKYRK
jgi:hypothetical protein